MVKVMDSQASSLVSRTNTTTYVLDFRKATYLFIYLALVSSSVKLEYHNIYLMGYYDV